MHRNCTGSVVLRAALHRLCRACRSGGRSIPFRALCRAGLISAPVLLTACVPETDAPPPAVEASAVEARATAAPQTASVASLPVPPLSAAPPPAPMALPPTAAPVPAPVGNGAEDGGNETAVSRAAAGDGPLVVAILLPLSGDERELGQTMLNGAAMAVFDHAAPGFALRPHDTGGTSAGAAAAAQAALEEGASLLLGPLFSDAVRAVAPIAVRAGVNAIAFTNDRTVAGGNIYVLGHHVEPQIRTVVAHAGAGGVRSIAALIPAGKFGEQAAAAASAAAAEARVRMHAVIEYTDETESIDGAVRRLAVHYRSGSLPGSAGFDAVLVPSGSNSVYAVAARLPYYDIPSDRVRVLGISTWNRLNLRHEPALAGAWYASPETELRRLFKRRFTESFDKEPGPLAALAYDATAVAALLARRQGDATFGADALVDDRGFEGASGLFRFRSDGLSERSYAVVEVGADGVKQVRAAQRSFAPAARQEARGGARPATN